MLANCETTPEEYEIKWHLGTPYFFCPQCEIGHFWDQQTRQCKPCNYFVKNCTQCNNDDPIIECDACDPTLFPAPGG